MIAYLQQYLLPRTLLLVLVSTWLLTFIAAYLYVLKHPLKIYSAQKDTLTLLERRATPGYSLKEEITAEKKQIAFYKAQLNQTDSKLPTNLLVAKVIGKLDFLAKQHSIQLISVEPRKTDRILLFDEMPFQIRIQGSYFELFRWLRGVEETLKPMVIKRFEINRGKAEDLRQMSLTLVSYRLQH
ncbi:MAG: type 4a pilus biogenesis protein PilO [Methylococcales bacterium]